MTDPAATALDLELAIDREVDLVTSAINLVAVGAAPSTVVAGLRLAETVLEIVRPLAVQRGVVIEPIWGPDEATQGIRVSRPVSG